MRWGISVRSRGMRLWAAAFAVIMAIPVGCFASLTDAYAAELSNMDNYPGVKKFNFASREVRSEVGEDCMVDPEYSIKMEKTMPDEYFGGKVITRTDENTGEVLKGFAVTSSLPKNGCGAICHNMFTYKGNWIDVKTTYVDWSVGSSRSAFFCGGFTRQRWREMNWVEMKHEFFLAGTDTPVEIKGFQNYADVDNCQGVLLEKGKIEDVWINRDKSSLKYDSVSAGTSYTLASGAVFRSGKEMLYIQTGATEDIAEEGNPGYDAETAAEYCMGFTFSASVINTCICDNSPSGFNVLESGYYKFIPSKTPEQGTPLIAKKVLDDDEDESESNAVKPEESWTYRVNAFLPEETEEYNFYSSFRIEDQIDENLVIDNVQVKRVGEDVSDLFTITQQDNLVSAEAINVKTKTFYGYDYILEITVSLGSDRDALEGAGLLDENCCFMVPNSAFAVYGTGKEDKEIPTNETITTIAFEKRSDIIITKEIASDDVYEPHGEVSFIFRLEGTTAEGEDKEYNRNVTFTEEYISGYEGGDGKIRRTAVFEDIPEGEYICSEYEILRFETCEIRDITGGEKSGNTVIFTVDGSDSCGATFVNGKTDWRDYSHSAIVVNRIGNSQMIE